MSEKYMFFLINMPGIFNKKADIFIGFSGVK